jgi:hypothetical protein
VAREKVARTRFSVEEHAQLEADAAAAGVTVGEYLRTLYLEQRDLKVRVKNLDDRLTVVEKYVAQHWAQEGRHATQGS